MTPKTHNQGKIVAEQDDGGGYLIMFPDGVVKGVTTRKKAERKIKSWCSANTADDSINFATVEWR